MIRNSTTSIIAAFVAFVLAAIMVNHGLVDSGLPDGPGLTLDESFNIDQGVYLVDAFSQHGPTLFTPTGAREVFGSQRYLPDHPPLGRVLLGMSHYLFSWLIPGSELTAYNVPAARLGSCFAFAVTVLLLAEFTRRKYGSSAGVLTAVLLIGTPHLIGHARLAALESATNLAWAAAMIPLLAWWTGPKPPSTLQTIVSGGLWGLLLLTKVQGIFLPPIVIVWAVWQFRRKAIRPLVVYGVAGAVVFYAGWPWLWLDPDQNLRRYLGRTTDRPTLYCWYFGQQFADKTVPWHFPFVMTLISLPVLTIVGMVMRAAARRIDKVEQFLLLCIVFPLIVFAVPGVPVYDGTRLFLIVMPPFAMLGARGFALWLNLDRWGSPAVNASKLRSRWQQAAVHLLMAVVPLFWTMQPLAISQYGPLAGGNRGAARIGMETSYWSDALNGDFWEQVPEDTTILVAPVSHQFQLSDIEALVPIVQQRRIKLVAYEYDPARQRGLLLLIHRLADLRPELAEIPAGARLIAEVTQDGVTFVRLINTQPASE